MWRKIIIRGEAKRGKYKGGCVDRSKRGGRIGEGMSWCKRMLLTTFPHLHHVISGKSNIFHNGQESKDRLTG